MAASDQLLLVGISHRATPLEARERCAVPTMQLGTRAKALLENTGATECVLLSTCNRTEVLLATDDPRAADSVAAQLFSGVAGVYTFSGIEALFHIFSVAAGLESQVIGESQVLAQLREALQHARDAGSCGALLGGVLDHALAAGRRVRAETNIGDGTLSVARAAVDLAAKISGDLRSARVLVIGCGETGLLVGRCLKERQAGALRFVNRTLTGAQSAARELGGTAHGLEELAVLLADCDVAIVAVEASQPVVRAEHFAGAKLGRRQRPMVLVDISVPRGIEAALRDATDLFVANMDDLESIVATHRVGRAQAADAAALILVAEVEKFHGLRAVQALKPQVLALLERFDGVRRELLASQGSRVSLERFSELLTQRLQEEALRVLKTGARDGAAEDSLLARYKNHAQEP